MLEWGADDQVVLDSGGPVWSGRGVLLFPEGLSGVGNPVLNSCAFVELIGAEVSVMRFGKMNFLRGKAESM